MSDTPTTGLIHDEHGPAAPAAPAPAQPAAVPGAGETFDAAWAIALANWTSRYIRNSPVAQSTEAWNHLGAVMPQLKTLLEAELMKR